MAEMTDATSRESLATNDCRVLTLFVEADNVVNARSLQLIINSAYLYAEEFWKDPGSSGIRYQ